MGICVMCVTCNFTEFFHDLDLALGLGNVAHKKAQVGDANVNFQVSPAFHFQIIQLRVYIATQSPLIIVCVVLKLAISSLSSFSNTQNFTTIVVFFFQLWSIATSLEQPKHPLIIRQQQSCFLKPKMN